MELRGLMSPHVLAKPCIKRSICSNRMVIYSNGTVRVKSQCFGLGVLLLTFILARASEYDFFLKLVPSLIGLLHSLRIFSLKIFAQASCI